MNFRILLIVYLSFGCDLKTSNQSKASSPKPVIAEKKHELTSLRFENKVVDIGEISDDTTINADYIFRNTGNKPLFIYNVNPNCICTAHMLSKKAVAPNDTGKLTLIFNSKDKYGEQIIYSTLEANTMDKLYRVILKTKIAEKTK